jgi:hypothetical protein
MGKHSLERSVEDKESIMADVDRPNPLKEVASKVGVAWATASAVVGALVTFGVWTAAQGDAVTAAGNAVPSAIEALGVVVGGLIPLVGAIVSAFHTAAAGKDHVTPVVAPMNNLGERLVPAASAPKPPALGREYRGVTE